MYNTPILHETYRLNFSKSPNFVSGYSVIFDSKSENHCIGMVDMVNSTKVSATLGNYKTSRYYEIFLNSMAKLIIEYGGSIIKNIGDCLLYYFPESIIQQKNIEMINCLESGMAMIRHHDVVCNILKKENLPRVDYRVSMDYGEVILMKSNTSFSMDMIGSPINMCAKINRYAPPNDMVIGGDLYEQVKHYDDYSFKEIDDFSLGFKTSYPIYSIKKGLYNA